MNRLVLLFPGQGAQQVGMGRDIASASQAAAAIYARADDLLGFPLSRLCFEGTPEDLERTDIQQPAIFATSAALWAAVVERGGLETEPAAAAGLSLGEYTALYAAGSFEFEDGLRLVHRRGQLMQQAALATPSGMVTLVGADQSAAQALCARASDGEVLGPANFNCPGQIVISGAKVACDRAVALADEFGVRAVPLKVAGAFHSPLMAPAAAELAKVLAHTPIQAPRLRVLSNVDADDHRTPDAIRESLCRQLTGPVRWQSSMERLIADGFARFVEIGPGRVLSGLMRKIDRQVKATNVGTADEVERASAAAVTTLPS